MCHHAEEQRSAQSPAGPLSACVAMGAGLCCRHGDRQTFRCVSTTSSSSAGARREQVTGR